MTNQLNKGTAKATGDILAHLEAEYAKMGTTIEYLRTLVPTNGHGGANGNGQLPAAKDPEAIVAKAQARFQATRKAPKRTPAEWRTHVLTMLRDADGPLSPLEMAEMSGGAGVRTSLYKALKLAAKDGAISRHRSGKRRLFYTLRGRPGPRVTHEHKRKRGQSLKLKQQRARTLELLSTFDLHKPRAHDGRPGNISKLLANGYLKRTPDGYVRTNKEFQVNPS